MTAEEIAKKYGGKKVQTSADTIAAKYGGTQGLTPTKTAEPEKKSLGRKVVDFFTGSTQKFGKTIGNAINAPKAAEMYGEDLIAHTDLQNQLIKAIQKKKALGQDTSQLEGALQAHLEATPKLEDYTGDVINKTTGQVLGEAGGTVLEALQGGVIGKGTEAAVKPTTTIGQKFISGAKLGAGYGAASGATQALEDKANPLTGALKGAAVGGATGGVLEAGVGAISNLASKKASRVAANQTQAEELAGKILLSEKGDQKLGAKVLKGIDRKGVKTYDDLISVLDSETKAARTQQDKVLAKDLTKRKISALDSNIDVSGTKVKHNYVKDAITDLMDYYKSSNNVRGQTEMKNLAAKARKEGLTVKEINDLARRHGKDLNAFNASGELSSGLSKQAAENTRSGLKDLVGTLDKSGKSRALDQTMSEKIKVLDLAKEVQNKVQNFKNKTEKVGLIKRVGSKVGKVANLATGRFFEGALRALQDISETRQLKPGEIEAQLQKRLKVLQKLETVDLSKETQESLAKKISDFINREALNIDTPIKNALRSR